MSTSAINDPMKIKAAREEWIRRYSGYFGDPPCLGDYRAGNVSFDELYRSAMNTANNMVTEADRCDYIAFDYWRKS